MRLATASKLPNPTDAVVAQLLAGRNPKRADREFLAWLEGMLTAAAIAPERTRPDAWLKLAFGLGHVFESPADAQTYMSAFALMHNAILSDLKRKGSGYIPRVLGLAEEGEKEALAIHWTEGFLAGMQLDREGWACLIAFEQGKAMFAPIAAFMQPDDGEAPIIHELAEDVAGIRKEALRLLGGAVFLIYEYWRAFTRQSAPKTVDPFGKTGRNDPCPCGSGKKYKKCCIGNGPREPASRIAVDSADTRLGIESRTA
jgi:uncharacterized protein